MRLKEGYLLRELAGETIVVAVGEAARHLQGVIRLNGSAAVLWRRLEAGGTRDELVAALHETFDATPEDAGADVDRFLDLLDERGLLEPDPPR